MREELRITIPEWPGGSSQSKIMYPGQENRKDERYEESTKILQSRKGEEWNQSCKGYISPTSGT